MSWQYLDPIRYSPEKFAYITDAFKKEMSIRTVQTDSFKNWQSKLIDIKNDIKSLSGSIISLFVCILVIGMLTIHWRGWNILYVGSIIVAAIVVLLYLYFGLDRAPFRVLVILWISILWMMLLVAANSRDGIKNQRWCHSNSKIVIGIILIIILLESIYKDVNNAQDTVKNRVAQQSHLEHVIQIWDTNLPKGSIIYNPGAQFPFEFHLPLKSFAYLRSIKGFIFTGCANQSPHQQRIINDLGLTNDFYGSLEQREHVYIVQRERNTTAANILQSHYREVYGLELSVVKAPNLPYLYQMFFKR
jgi:hypothetical protein